MWSRCKPRSIYDLFAVIGCFAALTTGAAYAANSIASSDIIDGQVRNPDLGTGAVSNGKLGSAAVGNSKIAYGAVTSTKIFNGGVDTIDLAKGAVTSEKLASGAVTRATRADPEIWHFIGDSGEPAFEGTWRNYSAETPWHQQATWTHAAFRKDDDGVVHLKGMIAGGAAGTVAFLLPEAYCPHNYNTFATVSDNTFARITVTFASGGTCSVEVTVGDTDWVSLSGISYLEAPLDARVRPAGGVGR